MTQSPNAAPPPQDRAGTYVEQHEPPTRPNPRQRNLLLRRVTRLPWWLLAIIVILGLLYDEFSRQQLYVNIWTSVEQGIEVTIFVTIRGFAIACGMGLLLAVMRMSKNALIYQISTFYVEVVRGVPTIILVYWVALAATPQLVDQVNILGEWLVQRNIDPFGQSSYLRDLGTRDVDQRYRVIVALAVSYSAFLSEIFRAGLESLPKGQIEAAQSLGLSRVQTFRLVILPQAFRVILPPLGNDFIAMLKESSLVSVVGVEDITRRGVTTAQSTFRFFEIYNVVALTYLVLTLSLAIMVKLLEAYIDGGVKYQPRHLYNRFRAWLQRTNAPPVPPSKG